MERNDAVRGLLRSALWDCSPAVLAGALEASPLFREVGRALEDDAHAFAAKDPSFQGEAAAIVRGSTSFRAVLHYRLANAIERAARLDVTGLAPSEELEALVLLLSSRGKLASGIEIHPRCTIGRRFVIDHGLGTVIGETVEIGDDAYILGGVTLGASGIASNPRGKRHPTLGHRVQVGAFASIFGPVTVGDDVFIGSHCRITRDIPEGCRVTVRSNLQITQCIDSTAPAA